MEAKMNKNKQLNQEHDRRMQERVRPKQPQYEFAELEKVVALWARDRLNKADE